MTRSKSLFLSVLLAALAVALAFNQRQLRLEYEEFRAAATEARAGVLLPTFSGHTLQGRELRIDQSDSRPQVCMCAV